MASVPVSYYRACVLDYASVFILVEGVSRGRDFLPTEEISYLTLGRKTKALTLRLVRASYGSGRN